QSLLDLVRHFTSEVLKLNTGSPLRFECFATEYSA
ncbi:hypothetical protein A2U01_0101425, partial [Trifolium medium]|nr:hypothetical protein [Trifolium medium]